MMPGFWGHNFGWFLFTGIVITGIITVSICGYFSSSSHKRRQVHRFRMQELRMRGELTAKGIDPDYVAMLEKKVKDAAG